MSNPTPSQDISRREALRGIALAVVAAGLGAPINKASGQQLHQQAANMKGALGTYNRQELTEREWETVTRLADLIVPADDVSGSASDAGAAEFIDLLCHSNNELAHIFHGGIAWLDAEMRQRHDTTFSDSSADAQTALLDELVAEEAKRNAEPPATGESEYARFRDYKPWDGGDLGPGVVFFAWARKMAVDAFYTSPVGLKDLDYRGNHAYSEYVVPEEAIDYVMSRSPFA